MELAPLPDLLLEPVVRQALAEDLGRAGDLTTEAVVSATARAELSIRAREPGVVAGVDLARLAWRLLDPGVGFEVHTPDGAPVTADGLVATVTGPARALLTGERVALNLLGHLSGVATATAGLVAAVAHTRTRVCCTRKTTPGLRAVEKYAVRAGGGSNHRFGLDDAVLVKDNHIAVAGGIAEAVRRVRGRVGHLVAVEVEVDTLAQLEEALAAGVDAVLLDNMTVAQVSEAVTRCRDHPGGPPGRPVVEASGRVTPATAGALAEAGVDVVSAGWITHSAPALDLGLDSD